MESNLISKEYRPRKFSEVIGQKFTINTFKKYSVDNRWPDVMFYEGNSGSGKTTTALIVAAIINCEHPILNKDGYYDPCLECASCKSILNETFSHDTHFFKSAEMEKNDIIELENLASQTPWHGGKKNVVVIDEIQSLGKSSKEATLNLLEKKRKDTIFILCTMDVSKIDKAILSRGQVYKFKSLNSSEIGEALLKNLSVIDPEETILIPSSVLLTIAQNSWGSIRQAQNYLQRCIDSELFTDELLIEELGLISEQRGYEILTKLLNKDYSFYDAIRTVKAEDFYIYSWAVISSVQKSIQTLDHEDFKYKSSLAMSQMTNYKELCNIYLSINRDVGSWFREYIYNYYIGEYMKKETPVLTRVRQKAN